MFDHSITAFRLWKNPCKAPHHAAPLHPVCRLRRHAAVRGDRRRARAPGGEPPRSSLRLGPAPRRGALRLDSAARAGAQPGRSQTRVGDPVDHPHGAQGRDTDARRGAPRERGADGLRRAADEPGARAAQLWSLCPRALAARARRGLPRHRLDERGARGLQPLASVPHGRRARPPRPPGQARGAGAGHAHRHQRWKGDGHRLCHLRPHHLQRDPDPDRRVRLHGRRRRAGAPRRARRAPRCPGIGSHDLSPRRGAPGRALGGRGAPAPD